MADSTIEEGSFELRRKEEVVQIRSFGEVVELEEAEEMYFAQASIPSTPPKDLHYQ